MSDWEFPENIEGWFTRKEGEALAALARDKVVLEIGSYKGRSTICMAQVANHVTCIDPFDSRATTLPDKGTLAEFQSNLCDYGCYSNVTEHVGTSSDVCGTLPPKSYDLVFIDGDHSRDAVWNDIIMARRLLKPGGLMAFHDYHSGIDMGVDLAVDELIRAGGILLNTHDTLAVVLPPKEIVSERSTLFTDETLVAIAMPHRGTVLYDAARALFNPSAMGVKRIYQDRADSLMAFNFNHLWCDALALRKQYKITHWVMMHSDVCPSDHWLDVMLAEMRANKCHLLSAVVPIKDGRGLTSTAMDGDEDFVSRRLSMKEVFQLPETFEARDVPFYREDKEDFLLTNTGLMLVDFTVPWLEKVCFRQHDTITHVNGRMVPRTLPEDWDWARQWAYAGAKVMATRKVGLYHEFPQFNNRSAWGAWDKDEEFFATER